MSSVKQKLNWKSLGEKFQALKDLRKGPETKTSVKNMVYPVVNQALLRLQIY